MARNPMLNEKAFRSVDQLDAPSMQGETLVRDGRQAVADVMTLQGTINKTFGLLFLCVLGAMITWANPSLLSGITWVVVFLVATVVGFVTCFKPTIAMFTAPVYSFAEGLLLGMASAAYNAQFHGIVFQAVAITILVFFIMLGIYRFEIIRVTATVAKVIMSATLAIAVLYLVSIVLRICGVDTSYLTASTPLSIGISVVICVVAALNFLLDFDFINRMTTQYTAPKYMEWYAGFGLMVTLIWLYLEILKLLGKTRSR